MISKDLKHCWRDAALPLLRAQGMGLRKGSRIKNQVSVFISRPVDQFKISNDDLLMLADSFPEDSAFLQKLQSEATSSKFPASQIYQALLDVLPKVPKQYNEILKAKSPKLQKIRLEVA